MSLLGWLLLAGGLALWSAAHLLRRVRPDLRARLGDAANPKDPSKGIFAVAIVAALLMMIYGYQWTPFITVWFPPVWTVHVTNLLMVLALYLYGAGATKIRVAQRIRHPQLIAFKTWALAHLLVNGDLASLVLFGGLLAWAVVEVVQINRAAGKTWTPPAWAGPGREVVHAGLTAALFGLVAFIHTWLGVYPFPS